jgi:hypothetical protein
MSRKKSARTSAKKPSPATPCRLDQKAREVMAARGVSPTEVARGTGTNKAVFCRWYYERKDLRLSTFERLVEYLGLELTEGPDEERH